MLINRQFALHIHNDLTFDLRQAQIARTLSPERARTTFLLLIVVPQIVHGLLPQVPSLPWLLGWLLDGMAALGGPAR